MSLKRVRHPFWSFTALFTVFFLFFMLIGAQLTAHAQTRVLATTASASAVQPATITMVVDPAVKVTVTKRGTNTAKTIAITVNKQDTVTVNVIPPVVVVPPVPVVPPGPVIMHGGMHIDDSTIPTSNLSAGIATDIVYQSGRFPNANDIGAFRSVCQPTHYAYDDPIVYPGQPGKAHLHVFFGNTLTSASSTNDSIINTGNATCRGGTINRSAYWVPTMVDGGNAAVIPVRTMIVYYKTGYNGTPTAQVQSIPQGLRMIAGDPSASAPVRWGAAGFSCDGFAVGSDHTEPFPDPNGPHSIPSLANCGVGHEVWANIVFPRCWDGVNLDAPDHRSHMAYSGGTCPADHPIALPEVAYQVVYPVRAGDDPGRWRLASDMYDTKLPGGYSMHGDLISAWKQDVEALWVKLCDQASADCGADMLGDGTSMGEFDGN